MFEPLHSHREVLPLRVSLPFFAGAMVMIFIVILSLFPQNSLVICSVGISTHWTWQNQASLRPPKMHFSIATSPQALYACARQYVSSV